MRLNSVYIGVGSNVEPEKNLTGGIRLLKTWFHVISVSPVYKSPAAGRKKDSPAYLNAAIYLETYVFLDLFRKRLKMIEARLGRRRFDENDDPSKLVTLDLDVLLFNDEISHSMIEPLPHPDVLTQGYVAVPLADLNPDKRHPVTGETFGEIAARLKGKSKLKPVDGLNI